MEPAPDFAELTAPPPARAIPPAAKALVFFNEKAGSVGPNDRQKLVEALGAADIGQYALVDAEKISPELFQHAHDFDVIIVLGGDGTARAAAELAPRDAPPMVLLPGGTLNILPKALYGDLAWPEALAAALDRGVIKKLPVGRANGEPFFVAALFGGTTQLVHVREAMREGKPLTAWRRFRVALKRSFMRSLRARTGRNAMRKIEAVGVLLPSFSGGIEAESLEWVNLDARHIFDFARVSIRAITADWRNDSAVEISQTRTGDIDAALGYVHATLDGEPRRFYSRVHIKYDGNGPRVLALDHAEDAT